VAHKFKGESITVGALELGKLCTQLERAGHEGTLSAAEALLPRLDAAILRVFAALEDRIACRS
jgi:HPt (histidine-containing phosphotransfer) domain-containing protein